MSLLDVTIGLLAPHRCIDCGVEGSLLCDRCDGKYLPLPERCYRCRRLTNGGRTCPSCQSGSSLRAVRAAVLYESAPKTLVWRLKFHGARAASRVMAAKMFPYLPDGHYLVPVPTATSRVRRRGYDQAKLLAREISRCSGLPYLNCLARSGQAHQVGASRAQRLRQLALAYRVKKPELIRGADIILVDDVITTGATLEAAAKVLRAAGARHVDAIVYAQP